MSLDSAGALGWARVLLCVCQPPAMDLVLLILIRCFFSLEALVVNIPKEKFYWTEILALSLFCLEGSVGSIHLMRSSEKGYVLGPPGSSERLWKL